MCAVPNMAVFWSSLTSCFLVCCSRIFWTTLKLLLLLLLLYYYLSLLWWIYPIIWAYVKENLFPVHIRLQLFCSSVYGTCNIISHNKTFTLVLSGVRAQCPIWRYFSFPMVQQPSVCQCLIKKALQSHSVRPTTLGRTPLDERPARHKDLYLTTHNSQVTDIHASALFELLL